MNVFFITWSFPKERLEPWKKKLIYFPPSFFGSGWKPLTLFLPGLAILSSHINVHYQVHEFIMYRSSGTCTRVLIILFKFTIVPKESYILYCNL